MDGSTQLSFQSVWRRDEQRNCCVSGKDLPHAEKGFRLCPRAHFNGCRRSLQALISQSLKSSLNTTDSCTGLAIQQIACHAEARIRHTALGHWMILPRQMGR